MPDSNYLNILAQVKAILLTATDVGTKVYDYQRWAATLEAFISLFKTGSVIKGWQIHRRATAEVAGSTQTNKRTHLFVIEGFYSLKDSSASEKTFQELLENVCDKFRVKVTLNATAGDAEPVQIITVDQRMFGAYLCHYAELNLSVEEEIQYITS